MTDDKKADRRGSLPPLPPRILFTEIKGAPRAAVLAQKATKRAKMAKALNTAMLPRKGGKRGK